MLPQLTEREGQILKLIARGLTNRELACLLNISEATIENHIHHIYLKLGISNRAQAVLHALQEMDLLRHDRLDLEEIIGEGTAEKAYDITSPTPTR